MPDSLGHAQTLIGLTTGAFCVLGFINCQWFLDNTTKGQRLVRRFGEDRAATIFRLIMAGGAVFGVLLGVGLIEPIEWSSAE